MAMVSRLSTGSLFVMPIPEFSNRKTTRNKITVAVEILRTLEHEMLHNFREPSLATAAPNITSISFDSVSPPTRSRRSPSGPDTSGADTPATVTATAEATVDFNAMPRHQFPRLLGSDFTTSTVHDLLGRPLPNSVFGRKTPSRRSLSKSGRWITSTAQSS